MKIHLKLNGKVIPATLANNRTAREFAAMLPLTITMHDLFKREKFGPLPGAISGKGTRTRAYEVGDMVCWAPGPDVSIFYRQDGQPIRGGLHVLGKLDVGAEAFGVPGALDVTIESVAAPTSRPEQQRPVRRRAHRRPVSHGDGHIAEGARRIAAGENAGDRRFP